MIMIAELIVFRSSNERIAGFLDTLTPGLFASTYTTIGRFSAITGLRFAFYATDRAI